ncbi:MAG: MBL fold metallo-hydrolase [Phycisphaeraceae bacterium]|nr:MBL fold metallo-hydrolase [Phycisphaerales bacterium]MCB9860225.1 MBL fold metallo-hydrolase [Phycisphaeraceae bacterium]
MTSHTDAHPSQRVVNNARLVFLGTGTSSGVPAVACTCPGCSSADPRDTRLRTSGALLFHDETGQQRVILIDAGPDLRQQALRAKLMRCDALLMTHNHVDHTWGIDELRRFNTVMKQSIPVYASEHTAAFLHRVYQHIFVKEANINNSYVASLDMHLVTPMQPFEIFGMRITPIPIWHGNLEVMAYRFDLLSKSRNERESLFPFVWCTDVSSIPEDSLRMMMDVRTLVLGALRHKPHETHMTINEAVAVAQNISASQTWFVHMGHEVVHAEIDPELPEGIRLAWDGLELASNTS